MVLNCSLKPSDALYILIYRCTYTWYDILFAVYLCIKHPQAPLRGTVNMQWNRLPPWLSYLVQGFRPLDRPVPSLCSRVRHGNRSRFSTQALQNWWKKQDFHQETQVCHLAKFSVAGQEFGWMVTDPSFSQQWKMGHLCKWCDCHRRNHDFWFGRPLSYDPCKSKSININGLFGKVCWIFPGDSIELFGDLNTCNITNWVHSYDGFQLQMPWRPWNRVVVSTKKGQVNGGW